MGLTSSLYTGLSGLNSNQTRIDTIGNNIANVNTTAFKSSRTLFQTQLYSTISGGSPPSANLGGSNPIQVGHGSIIGTTSMNFTNGPLETTGIASDLAIEGAGFFIVNTDENTQLFTRDGSFTLDASNQLVTTQGYRVQGFGVDAAFEIDRTNLQSLSVPVGTETVARATESVTLEGDLSSLGDPGSISSETRSQALVDGAGNPVTAATLLTDVRDAAAPGVALFAANNTLTAQGVTKGERELPDTQFVVGVTGNTLGDYAAWLQEAMGIQDVPGLPGNPGVSVDGATGELVVRSNVGEQNSITLGANDVLSDNPGITTPFQFQQVQAANGESVFTGFTVYDSLGNPVQVQVTFVLEDKPNAGPVWRYYAESPDTSGAPRALGNGTVSFDNDGNVRQISNNSMTVMRDTTGALSPLTFDIDFSSINGLSTQSSSVILGGQDGFPPGTLSGFAVDSEGLITGVFTNGLTRTLGQIAMGVFPNPEGMIAESQNLFSQGVSAGPLAITTAGDLGAGYVRSGALELSNVDLGAEFIGLVTASTGFQASSRVITTTTDMLNQLLAIVR